MIFKIKLFTMSTLSEQHHLINLFRIEYEFHIISEANQFRKN
jgi:hypothetical protein